MAIQWNKVTWYSKLLALVLFVALPFIGFYYGMQYGKTAALVSQVSVSMPNSASSNYYSDPTEWQTDTNNTSGGFSIAYPIDFDTTDNYNASPSSDWRLNAADSGIKYFTLTVPRAFEPQTNFVDATLSVGASANNNAVAHCLAPDQNDGPATPTSTAAINGITFTVFKSSGAGAGNYYDTTSYRTLHAGECYAVEYTIHSSQIANYPASYNLQPFDQGKINSLMQGIVGTFKFQ